MSRQPVYRVVDPGVPLDSAQVDAAIFARVPADDQIPPTLVIGVWYCHCDECPVRGVQVEAHGIDRSRRLACPTCGGEMTLVAGVREVALVPVEGHP